MWKDFFMFCWWWQWWITHYICVALFGLQITFKESHLIFRTTCDLLKASLQMSKQLKDDKQLAQDHIFSGNGGWLWTSDFPFWDLILVLFMNPYNANLKAIFPPNVHSKLYISVKIILPKSIWHTRCKRPKGKGMGKEGFVRVMACSSVRFPF